MLTGIDAVIFDLDGSLVDSMWIWTSIDEEYLAKYNLTMPNGFHEAMEGMSFSETARYFLDTFPQLHCSAETVQEEWLHMAFDKYTTQVPLKDGAYDFIQNAKAQGVKFGIATSNTRALVDATLQVLQVADLFDSVRTSCEVKAGKPAPDVYLKVADDLKVNPEHCLVFEDVPMGILAGKNAGMRVCAVDDAFSRPQEAKKKQLADYYIYHFDEIKKKTYEVL